METVFKTLDVQSTFCPRWTPASDEIIPVKTSQLLFSAPIIEKKVILLVCDHLSD